MALSAARRVAAAAEKRLLPVVNLCSSLDVSTAALNARSASHHLASRHIRATARRSPSRSHCCFGIHANPQTRQSASPLRRAFRQMLLSPTFLLCWSSASIGHHLRFVTLGFHAASQGFHVSSLISASTVTLRCVPKILPGVSVIYFSNTGNF